MANTNRVTGARVVGSLGSGTYHSQVFPYLFAASDATAAAVGDFVKSMGTAATNETGQLLPVVAQAGAGETVRGVIVGFEPPRTELGLNYRKASTLRTVYVDTDPFLILEIQSNGTGAVGDIGANADIVVGTLDTIYGASATQLDESTVGTGATKQLRILGVVPRQDNEIGQYVKYLCKINLHELTSTTGV